MFSKQNHTKKLGSVWWFCRGFSSMIGGTFGSEVSFRETASKFLGYLIRKKCALHLKTMLGLS